MAFEKLGSESFQSFFNPCMSFSYLFYDDMGISSVGFVGSELLKFLNYWIIAIKS